MSDLIELDRRISRAITKGNGIRFSDEELDLFVAVGAIEKLKIAASEALTAQAQARRDARVQREIEAAKRLEAPTARRPPPSADNVGKAAYRAQRVGRRGAPQA